MSKIIIGTHHKSGTNFFLKVLKELHEEQVIKLWDRNSSPESRKKPLDWDVYFDHWSRWITDISKYNFKGIHSIRHPASLIYSAAKYHCKSKESWLHVPKEEYNGKTYAQVINSFSSIEDKLLFEMRNASKTVIERMLEVKLDKRFYHLKLEEVSSDSEMLEIKRALDFCEIKGDLKETWLSVCKKNCLWNLKDLPKHSTTGVSSDWEKYFTSEVLDEYRVLFGQCEELLGYEAII
jgi:hypothetical protein